MISVLTANDPVKCGLGFSTGSAQGGEVQRLTLIHEVDAQNGVPL